MHGPLNVKFIRISFIAIHSLSCAHVVTEVSARSDIHHSPQITHSSVDLIHRTVMNGTRIYLGCAVARARVCVYVCVWKCYVRQEQCHKSNEACSTRPNTMPNDSSALCNCHNNQIVV